MTKKTKVEITLGPIPFLWNADRWRDFYFQIADEAPVSAVYIGETICSKRSPFTMPLYGDVMERLEKAGKTVIFSTLGEVAVPLDRKLVKSVCAMEDRMVEANDTSALWHVSGRPHAIGPLMNVYNEETLKALARRGASRVSLPSELPAKAIEALSQTAKDLNIALEVQVFGRTSLALSARCYHARAHGRIKDNCMFVCENDPDGMDLKTLSGDPFLTVNGIQTLSYASLNLAGEMPAMTKMGIAAFRLSPHSRHMIETAHLFRRVADGALAAQEAGAALRKLYPDMPFANGFYHQKPGHQWVAA